MSYFHVNIFLIIKSKKIIYNINNKKLFVIKEFSYICISKIKLNCLIYEKFIVLNFYQHFVFV
ncbi:MAG: hypothetical protein COZ59_00460 [Bacteroidetes bacterium CG_4_8_14_3_um_filter_31_14]|nr:MAG: hypothetical protein COZ59_00460 [Bacteroidetes bacterium CG_4_8_14_3_um_filter_31_14]